MSHLTKDDRAAAPQRVRMTGSRSASTRSRAGHGARIRARRRRRSRTALTALLCAVLLIAVAGAGALLLRGKPVPEPSCPIRYPEAVNAAAAEFDIEPAYLYAVILAESSFRPEVRSNVGATGLMQIMPETGEWIARKLDMDDMYTADMLTDPEVNVRLGGWYLRFLLDRYNGDKRCASAAYHAGQGTVDRWLADPAASPDGQTLAVIAYDSTDHYVNKVLKYYEEYLSLLSENG